MQKVNIIRYTKEVLCGMSEKEFTLRMDELHFDAAHYLNEEYGKCQFLHGHRWHVRDLSITETKIIDFSLIKKLVDSFDHCVIIPEKDKPFWEDLQNVNIGTFSPMPCKIRFKTIPYDLTLVENIKLALKEEFLKIDGVKDVSFILYETDNDGVISFPDTENTEKLE